MIRCKNCGAYSDEKAKFCTYCGFEINSQGQVFQSPAFKVSQIFSVGTRFILIGTALQPIKLKDVLKKDNKSYAVIGMQEGNATVQKVEANTNCGLMLENLSKKDVKEGDTFSF